LVFGGRSHLADGVWSSILEDCHRWAVGWFTISEG
jgi:hypothetical protein